MRKSANSQAMGEFAKTYSQMTDDQLLGLSLERDALLPEARSALLAEVQKRSLAEPDAAARAEHIAGVEGGRKRRPGEVEKVGLADLVYTDGEEVSPPSLEVVFGSTDASEAQQVQGLLESKVDDVTIQRGLLSGAIRDFGAMQLLVAAERADDARRLIATSRREAAVEGESPVEGTQDLGAGVPGKYRTFWRRFLAGWIDSLILSFIENRTLSWPWFISTWVPTVYEVIMLAVWGQTVGKMICKIIVLDISENPITFKHAIMRSIVPIVFNLSLMGYLLTNNETSPESALNILYFGLIWFLLELLTMLTNKKRRAIHDFIAGTVVCKRYA